MPSSPITAPHGRSISRMHASLPRAAPPSSNYPCRWKRPHIVGPSKKHQDERKGLSNFSMLLPVRPAKQVLKQEKKQSAELLPTRLDMPVSGALIGLGINTSKWKEQ